MIWAHIQGLGAELRIMAWARQVRGTEQAGCAGLWFRDRGCRMTRGGGALSR